jgi:hypothetical protein
VLPTLLGTTQDKLDAWWVGHKDVVTAGTTPFALEVITPGMVQVSGEEGGQYEGGEEGRGEVAGVFGQVEGTARLQHMRGRGGLKGSLWSDRALQPILPLLLLLLSTTTMPPYAPPSLHLSHPPPPPHTPVTPSPSMAARTPAAC